MSVTTPAEVRAARSFLDKRGLSMSAQRLAAAAKEQQKSFRELLSFIMRVYQGRQNESAQRNEVILAASKAGK